MSEILAPAGPAELSQIVAAASAARTPIMPWGAGAHQHLGGAQHPDALILRMSGMRRVLEYAPADLTVTAEAGVSLAEIQALLRPHGQWLPWDPPGAAVATIGGLLAAGRSGPLRLGYGTPRDWLLGARVVLGDGRLVKSGGKVVKNVAGYDLHKLHLGALGTLGVLAAVTFKIAPLPERAATVMAACREPADLAGLANLLLRPPLAPDRLVVLDGPAARALIPELPADLGVVLARYAGIDAAVERQVREARARIGARVWPAADAVQIDADLENVWRGVAEFATPDARMFVLRAGVRPDVLPMILHALAMHVPSGVQVIGYPGIGLAYARWDRAAGSDPHEPAAFLAAIRAALAPYDAYTVVEAAPPDLRVALDLWGPPPATLPIMRALKQKWDPAGILNPGRYLPGL